jgi:phage terminase large subunit GpA-like protein
MLFSGSLLIAALFDCVVYSDIAVKITRIGTENLRLQSLEKRSEFNDEEQDRFDR